MKWWKKVLEQCCCTFFLWAFLIPTFCRAKELQRSPVLHRTFRSNGACENVYYKLWYIFLFLLLQEAVQGGQKKVWPVFKLEVISQMNCRILERSPVLHDLVLFVSKPKRRLWQGQERRERGQEKSPAFNAVCAKWLFVFKITFSHTLLHTRTMFPPTFEDRCR